MQKSIRLKRALISVYHKTGLENILQLLDKSGIEFYSTGGTLKLIQELGYPVHSVESITGFPSICDGRVKTLHPAIFAGILARKDHEKDLAKYKLPRFDLVIVDLYPFEETLSSTTDESEIIEKIDIGGISLIRAAAKNYKNCIVVPSQEEYSLLENLLKEYGSEIPLLESKKMAARAFRISNHYDNKIFNYLDTDSDLTHTVSYKKSETLRYGENPHQKAWFFGDLNDKIEQLQGKALSYNNLVDLDAAINLIEEFNENQIAAAVIKHTNACGLAIGNSILETWQKALSSDPISAFGGVIIINQELDLTTAKSINKIFFELLVVRAISEDALAYFASKKKKRTIVVYKKEKHSKKMFKSLLTGVLVQEKDLHQHDVATWENKGGRPANKVELIQLHLANIAVKHLKSNAISIVKNNQIIGIGCGQTSRIDALNQAIEKAKNFEFDLKGAVIASDAFFPFADCIEIAHKIGIEAIVQPGGSIRDEDTINYAVKNGLCLMLSGQRHFKH